MFAIVAISADGVALAVKLKAAFPGSAVYALHRYEVLGVQVISGNLVTFTGELFEKYKHIVFIMAAGIAVRCIAPYIRHKSTDPAVVVVDEQGKFAISLLSGHLGGANEVAEKIAGATGAIPVITTASDIKGLTSVDMLAKHHGLIIHDLDEAKQVTALMVNGHKVAVVNETVYDIPLSGQTDTADADGLVFITHKETITYNKPFAWLLVPNIFIGIGCRRGTGSDTIYTLIMRKLSECNIDKRCIRHLASVDLKADEPGIREACRLLGVTPVFISRGEIQEVEHLFAPSQFVKEATGVSSVCEPAAYIAGGRDGRFLLHKQSENGVTVAFFEGQEGEGRLSTE
jgi:cobalt-precorrin 5A hydrolase